MYNNQKFYTVTEANVLSNNTVGTQVYVFLPNYNDPEMTAVQAEEKAKSEAQSKLYRLWGYGAKPDEGENRQMLSACMMEYSGNRALFLECKVFDYRGPEPVYPEWVQPGEEDEGYMIGARVHHNDKNWESTVDNNKNEPGVEGWNELTE